MKIKMYKRKPRGSGVFLVQYYGSENKELVYVYDKFIFDYPNMQGSQPLDECESIVYSSNKLDFETVGADF